VCGADDCGACADQATCEAVAAYACTFDTTANACFTSVFTTSPIKNIATTADGDVYEMQQLHFHWGADDTTGSEHTSEGESFPLEMHFVHQNTKYPDGTHGNYADGYLVFGVTFQLGAENAELQNALTKLPADVSVKNSNTQITLDAYALLQGEIEDAQESFYHYNGSLTTPGCTEAVQWYVTMSQPTVSSAQLALLRGLFSDVAGTTAITHNYRPVQAVGTREVFKREPTIVDSGAGALSANVFLATILAVFALVFRF
jgi:carbonic anhydrase